METFLIILDYSDKDGGTDYGGWGCNFYKIEAKDIREAMEKAACMVVIFVKQNLTGTVFDKDYSLNTIYSKDRFYEFGASYFHSSMLRQEKAQESIPEVLERVDTFRRMCFEKGEMPIKELEKRLGGKPGDFEVYDLDKVFGQGKE